MTLRLEKGKVGHQTMLNLIGGLRSDDIETLRSEIEREGPGGLVLNLRELNIIDLSGVRYLLVCQSKGLELTECPPYVREWMKRESQGRG